MSNHHRVPFRIEGFYKILENLVGSNALVKHLLEPYPEQDEETPYYFSGVSSIGTSKRYAAWMPNPDKYGEYITR